MYEAMTLDRVYEFGALFAYLAVLLWIGLRSARKVHSWVDYTLAGRNVSWVIVLATTAAPVIGGGAPGGAARAQGRQSPPPLPAGGSVPSG